MKDDERSGRPSDVDNDQLRALVEPNTCTIARELASVLDVTYTTIFNQLREIGKTKKFIYEKNLKVKNRKNFLDILMLKLSTHFYQMGYTKNLIIPLSKATMHSILIHIYILIIKVARLSVKSSMKTQEH